MQENATTKWLNTPAAHISTAAFIAVGMLAALVAKLLLHNAHIETIVLWIAIGGASIPLVISLGQ